MFIRENLTYAPVPLPHRQDLSASQMERRSARFFAFMKTRHTVRDFLPEPVDAAVIEACIATAGQAPSGANHQPWHFVAIRDLAVKQKIRAAAEAEEQAFYEGGAGEEWLKALAPIGTGPAKPHLEIAPWLIVVFAQRYGQFSDGAKYKNYYVTESVGIASGFLIAALHHAGLATLTHTPNPMGFLTELLGRPKSEKPLMIIAAGKAAPHATVPAAAMIKKPLEEILTIV